MSGSVKPTRTKPSSDSAAVGDRVIELRSGGSSFASIAKTVGVARSRDAFTLFVNALATRPATEAARLRSEEGQRLDALERRTARTADGEERERKLASLEKLRRRLIAP